MSKGNPKTSMIVVCPHLQHLCLACCRDKELAAVKITTADVEIIMSELEVDQKQADRRLREHQGSVLKALRSYLKV